MKKDRHVTADVTRRVTPEQMDAQIRGGRRIAPGLWQDADGDLHFSVPELLALVELEDTPENRAAVVRSIEESIKTVAPDIPIIRQDPK